MNRIGAALLFPLLLALSCAAAAQCRSLHGIEQLIAERQPQPAAAKAPGAWSDGLTLAQLRTAAEVHERIAKVAARLPPFGICASDVMQAIAIPASATLPDGVIIFSSGILRALASDQAAFRDSVAVVMAHEYAHILEEHGKKKAEFSRQANARGSSVGRSVALATGNLSAAILSAVQESLTQQQAFSRAVELEADRVGYELYISAGFDPKNAAKPLRMMIAMRGTAPVHYLDSHPALDDRIARLDALARDDVAKADRARNAEVQATANVAYVARARELWEAKRWRDLAAYVDGWLGQLPDSSRGWYYRGLLMRGSSVSRQRAWEAFERAVNFDPTSAEAWGALCVSLLESGHQPEAAVCVGAMAHLGHATEDLRERAFNGRLWVGGRIEALSPPLWWAREPSGSRLITNDASVLRSRGIALQELPPRWLPPSRRAP